METSASRTAQLADDALPLCCNAALPEWPAAAPPPPPTAMPPPVKTEEERERAAQERTEVLDRLGAEDDVITTQSEPSGDGFAPLTTPLTPTKSSQSERSDDGVLPLTTLLTPTKSLRSEYSEDTVGYSILSSSSSSPQLGQLDTQHSHSSQMAEASATGCKPESAVDTPSEDNASAAAAAVLGENLPADAKPALDFISPIGKTSATFAIPVTDGAAVKLRKKPALVVPAFSDAGSKAAGDRSGGDRWRRWSCAPIVTSTRGVSIVEMEQKRRESQGSRLKGLTLSTGKPHGAVCAQLPTIGGSSARKLSFHSLASAVQVSVGPNVRASTLQQRREKLPDATISIDGGATGQHDITAVESGRQSTMITVDADGWPDGRVGEVKEERIVEELAKKSVTNNNDAIASLNKTGSENVSIVDEAAGIASRAGNATSILKAGQKQIGGADISTVADESLVATGMTASTTSTLQQDVAEGSPVRVPLSEQKIDAAVCPDIVKVDERLSPDADAEDVSEDNPMTTPTVMGPNEQLEDLCVINELPTTESRAAVETEIAFGNEQIIEQQECSEVSAVSNARPSIAAKPSRVLAEKPRIAPKPKRTSSVDDSRPEETATAVDEDDDPSEKRSSGSVVEPRTGSDPVETSRVSEVDTAPRAEKTDNVTKLSMVDTDDTSPEETRGAVDVAPAVPSSAPPLPPATPPSGPPPALPVGLPPGGEMTNHSPEAITVCCEPAASAAEEHLASPSPSDNDSGIYTSRLDDRKLDTGQWSCRRNVLLEDPDVTRLS